MSRGLAVLLLTAAAALFFLEDYAGAWRKEPEPR